MKRPLLIRLAHGSITKAETTAIVVSHFRGIPPGGAEAAVDRVLRGAISRFIENGILKGDLGEFFPIPALAGELSAQVAVVMGLGDYDVFTKKMREKKENDPDLLRKIMRRLVEGMLQLNIPSFSTILFGAGGGGLDAEEASYDFLRSLAEALTTLDPSRRIHEVTLAEADGTKLPAIKRGFERAGEEPSASFLLELRELRLPPVEMRPPEAKKVMYMTVRSEEDVLKYSILTDRPVEVMVKHQYSPQAVRELSEAILQYGDRAWLEGLNQKGEDVRERLMRDGRDLRVALIPREIMDHVRNMSKDFNLILSLDQPLAYIPWELIYDDELERFLCQLPLGRQVREEYSSFRRGYGDAKDDEIDMLIVANPTGDLPEAEEEGRRLKELIEQSLTKIKVDLWERSQVQEGLTKSRDLISRLNTGRYEILHYSGHAFFDEVEPKRSGWIVDIETREKIEAFRFENTPRPPVLVFDNACESGRFQKPDQRNTEIAYGLAEGFIKAGVNLYLGTTWEVDDRAASVFAEILYRRMIADGKDLGEAMALARNEVLNRFGFAEPTWASYVLYGTPSFRF
ncbi:MAG: CHAT domain-containing protein [candidate division NC10 bacterium]|nr:CHAT domain-containing protein [candidate division NC10 bacterium]